MLGLTGYLLSSFVWHKSRKERLSTVGKTIGSPLALVPALKFAVFFTAILFLTHITRLYLPAAIFLIALLSGLVEVDAITISLASMPAVALPTAEAATPIVIAALANTFSKWFLVNWLGTKRMSKEVGKVFVLLLILGVILLLFNMMLI